MVVLNRETSCKAKRKRWKQEVKYSGLFDVQIGSLGVTVDSQN